MAVADLVLTVSVNDLHHVVIGSTSVGYNDNAMCSQCLEVARYLARIALVLW